MGRALEHMFFEPWALTLFILLKTEHVIFSILSALLAQAPGACPLSLSLQLSPSFIGFTYRQHLISSLIMGPQDQALGILLPNYCSNFPTSGLPNASVAPSCLFNTPQST